MTTYVLRDGKLVEKDEASPLHNTLGKGTYLTLDGMDHTWHPASGKHFDSKSRFRAETKAHGCIEIGDQKNYGRRTLTPKLDNRQRANDIKRAIYELRNGRGG